MITALPGQRLHSCLGREDEKGPSSEDCRDYQEVKVQEQVPLPALLLAPPRRWAICRWAASLAVSGPLWRTTWWTWSSRGTMWS